MIALSVYFTIANKIYFKSTATLRKKFITNCNLPTINNKSFNICWLLASNINRSKKHWPVHLLVIACLIFAKQLHIKLTLITLFLLLIYR